MVRAHGLRPRRTKRDDVISPRTRKNTGGIIVGVAIRRRARRFEFLGVIRWTTDHGIPVHPSTTILIGVEHIARAPARHRLAAGLDGELLRAGLSQVVITAGDRTVSGAVEGFDGEGEVEPVDEADVVEVQGGEGELRQRRRRHAGGSALKRGAARAGQARAVSVSVEVAPGSAPDPATPPDRSCEDDGLARL